MLKKTFIATIMLVLISAPAAFALSTTLPPASDSFKYNISSNVSCVYAASATYVNYVLACKHLTGTRIFGVSEASSKVYYKENTSTDASAGYVGVDMQGAQPQTDVGSFAAGMADSDFTTNGFLAL